MAAVTVVNGTDADIVAFGGGATTAAKRASTAVAANTDAQNITGIAGVAGVAILTTTPANSDKAKIAGVLLDDIITSVDLSTPAKRKAFRLKRGLSELYDILAQIGA